MIYDQDNSNPERRVLLATSAAAQLEHDPGEVAQRNDQPMDFVKHAMLYNYLKPISVSEERLGDYLQLGSSKSSDESMAKDSLGK